MYWLVVVSIGGCYVPLVSAPLVSAPTSTLKRWLLSKPKTADAKVTVTR